MCEATLFERWGLPVDVFRERPLEELQAFAAIAAGMNKREEREAEKAQDGAGPAGRGSIPSGSGRHVPRGRR